MRSGTCQPSGIQPSSAEVYVDGQFYGPVSNFTPRTQPLALSPGRHRVEIRAQGYQDMTFDADITAGQVDVVVAHETARR